MNLSINYETPPDIWWNFVNKSHQYNIFSSRLFLQSINAHYDLISILSGSNILLAALILKDRNGNPLHKPEFFTLYIGLYFSCESHKTPSHRKYTQRILLIDFLLRNCSGHYPNFTLSLHHTIDDLRAFKWFQLNNQNSMATPLLNLDYTAILDFREYDMNFDNYLSKIRSTRRQEFNKNTHLTHQIGAIEDINKLVQLHKNTLEGQGVCYSQLIEHRVINISEYALKNGYGELLLCKSNDEVIAANLILWDESTSYYLFGATHANFRRISPGTSLLLHSMKRSITRGNLFFDFVGINSPNRGDYKMSFNPKPFQYYSITKEKSLI